jgi:hypothetical protein
LRQTSLYNQFQHQYVMKNKIIESKPPVTQTKAMYNLMEQFEGQTKRINIVEQQFLALSERMSNMEGPNYKARSFR